MSDGSEQAGAAGGETPAREAASSPPPAGGSGERVGHPAEDEADLASASSELDALFCRIAVRSGLLDPSRAEDVLLSVRGQPPGAAAALCVARGWLNASQTRALQASVGAADEASPDVAGEGAREFARLVEMKRLAEDGRVEACRLLQAELSATPYARLGELLVQKAQRRAGAPAEGIPSRQQAFDTYVRLKQAVQRGAVDEAIRLAEGLRGDPEFGRLSQVQVERARNRRAIAEAGERARATHAADAPGDPEASGVLPGVTHCPTCGTSTRGDTCPRCRDSDTNLTINHP